MLQTKAKPNHFTLAEAKRVTVRASDYFKNLFPEFASNFRMEEIVLVQRPKAHWAVTFGYRTPQLAYTNYKIVNVDAKSYDLLGVTMRE